MIRYALKCSEGHGFESWFQNAAAFDGLMAKKLVTCPECATDQVEKAVMAPQVRPAGKTVKAREKPGLEPPQSKEAKDLRKLKARVEAESEYVGLKFTHEARAIHDGDAPERMIYGEAKPEDAKKLLEDGVPVIPLPFIPGRKTH